jgi:membrane protein YdbS with pleckstrin-like domain
MISAGLVIIVLWMIPLVAWLGRSYTVTSRRIVFRSGLVVRVRREILHSRGYHVVVRQNALQRVFGSGDLQFTTGHDQWIVMRDVPDVDLVQEAVHDVVEASARPGF